MRTPVPAVKNFVTAELVVDDESNKPNDTEPGGGTLDFGEDEEETQEDKVGDELIRSMRLDPDIYGVDDQPDLDALIDIYGQEPDDTQDDNQDDEDPQQAWLAESGYDAQFTPPWAPVPTAVGKKWIEKSPDAQIDIVFPTVYEEDRTAKLKDLGTANGLGVISHQRMSEQMAKELGFEQYEYTDEMRQIQIDAKTISPTTVGVADDVASGVLGLNVGPGGKITPKKGLNVGPGGGSTGPAGQIINAPAPGMATERGSKTAATGKGQRAELSGDSTRAFRRDQGSKSSATQPN